MNSEAYVRSRRNLPEADIPRAGNLFASRNLRLQRQSAHECAREFESGLRFASAISRASMKLPPW